MKNNFVFLLLVFGISVNVTAAPPEVPLTVSVEGNGFVTSDPAGLICQTECTENYRKNSTITLTATAITNSSFLGWQDYCVGTQPTCEVKMTAQLNITAVFSAVTPIYPAPVPQTGQTRCWDDATGGGALYNAIDCTDTAQDGDLQEGVSWPNPRFADNGDGSVTDNLTGLVWLKNINCFGQQDWLVALTSASSLGDGACGLTDGSNSGDWRIPNVKELQSIVSYQVPDPTLPAVDIWALPEGHPFVNLIRASPTYYWTSTTVARDTGITSAFVIQLNDGSTTTSRKTGLLYPPFVWPVRSPE